MPPARRRSILAKPLILCVNDNPSQLTCRASLLEQSGFTVLSATNVTDAVLILLEAPVSCTIADHTVQGRTSEELAKDLKSIKPDVPFILYSASIPTNLRNIDVYINTDEPTTAFLRIVREVVERFAS